MRLMVLSGLLTGRLRLRPADADTPGVGQLAADGDVRPDEAHSACTTGREAAPDPLGRVEVDGVTWMYLGDGDDVGEPLWARKCMNADCSQCGHLPGPVGGAWLALMGPLAALADRPEPEAPSGPQTAAQPFRPFLGSLAGALTLPGCRCGLCEWGRAQMSGRPDTPGD